MLLDKFVPALYQPHWVILAFDYGGKLRHHGLQHCSGSSADYNLSESVVYGFAARYWRRRNRHLRWRGFA